MVDFIKLQGIFENGYGFIAKKVMKDKRLHIYSKAIYSYICSYSGKGNDAFPSQKLICADLGISKDSLSKYLKPLKEFGYITTKQDNKNGKFGNTVYTINIVPCMISSDTVSTDTDDSVYGETDTNNNSILNNNNIINNNNLDISSIAFSEFVKEYADIVTNATGVAKNIVEQSIFNNMMTLKKYDCQLLLQKIKESDYLMGKLERKPSVSNFSRKTMIDRIMADEYKSKEEIKQETKSPTRKKLS